MATQKQIDANRINAQKSTGPTSPEGKAVSKRNRLTHGLRAEEHVLPGEDPAEFQAFVDAWVEDWKPTTMARLELVEEAATAAWRRKRCRRVETARLSKRVRVARNRHSRDETARLDAAMVHFFDDPQPALDAHLRSRDGVDRLVALWSEIERASLSIDTWTEYQTHHYTLIALRGHCPADPPMIELRDASWSLYLRNTPEDRGDDEPIGDDEAADVADWIHGMAVQYLQWLATVRAGLPDAMHEAQAQAFEPKPEDAVLMRYEGMLSREFHRSLGDLVKLTKSGVDLVESETNAPNEPNLSTESLSVEDVAADSEIAETDVEEHPAAAESSLAGSEEGPGTLLAAGGTGEPFRVPLVVPDE